MELAAAGAAEGCDCEGVREPELPIGAASAWDAGGWAEGACGFGLIAVVVWPACVGAGLTAEAERFADDAGGGWGVVSATPSAGEGPADWMVSTSGPVRARGADGSPRGT
ncbi:MAG TPA: hypothetical protein VMU36_07345, partial [Spirochaetia bacterium]|nr:hypothetical protein [Spirochaetia bacterium]